ncbi:MAG: hypothetical protein RMJ35_07560, partial [Phycisphaerales bacterium]|nr:hypothetical protein [Phycisphaerales bacterium]
MIVHAPPWWPAVDGHGRETDSARSTLDRFRDHAALVRWSQEACADARARGFVPLSVAVALFVVLLVI